jgi:hypothetical protein
LLNVISFRRLLPPIGAAALIASLALSGCADTTATTAPTAAALSSIVLSSSTVVGGTSLTGVVSLTAAAPTAGAAITLASSTTAVTVPASVTVAAGATTLTFAITTTSVAATTTITATYGTGSQAATLVTTVSVVPTLQNVLLSTNVASAGEVLQGTVTLTAPAPVGGLPVALTSNSTAATVPATVVVPLGNTSQTFPIDVVATPATSGATISASYSGVVRTAAFSIGQLALAIAPASIAGGLSTTGTVTLPSPAPDGGAPIALSSTSPIASVPAVVVVPAGATSQTFAIATTNAPPTAVTTISATYAGATQTATLTVIAYPVVVGMTCTPSNPSGGATVQCTGTLAGPSPASGFTLVVASSNAAVTAPPPFAVASSAQSFQFSLQTTTVTASTPVTVQVFDSSSGFTLWTVGLSVVP